VTAPTAGPFGARLADAVAARGPVCVGVDPHAALLDAWGLPDDPAGLERFALSATEALAPHVAALKPQSAFFERHGSRGVAVLERVVATAREAGCLVVLDVKRGDIGSTSQAYADAYLDPRSPLASDAVTVSPYLGTGSLDPFVTTARAHGAGLFVLAFTSNPEGPQFQSATTARGRSVGGEVLDHLRALNAGEEHGSFGAVVGATVGETGETYDVGGPLLVPGVGAQGGTVDDVRRVFGAAAHRVVPSTSREVLAAGPDPAALRDAAARTNDAFAGLVR